MKQHSLTIAACAVGTLAIAGVARSQIASREIQRTHAMKLAHEQILTVDVRSERAAMKVVDYLKKSKSNYYIEMKSSKGKTSKITNGSVSMADLKVIKQKMPKWRTPGQGGDGPIAHNANNGEWADAGHISHIVWGNNATTAVTSIGSILKAVNKNLYRVDLYEKIDGKGVLGKKLKSMGAGGM